MGKHSFDILNCICQLKQNMFLRYTPDPGFLERRLICINVRGGGGGVRFADFISFFLNIA